MDKQSGTCCTGTFCTSPQHLQLWQSGHRCSICKGMVHLNGVCPTASYDENGDNVFKCAPACLSKHSVTLLSSTPTNTIQSTPPEKPKPIAKTNNKHHVQNMVVQIISTVVVKNESSIRVPLPALNQQVATIAHRCLIYLICYIEH